MKFRIDFGNKYLDCRLSRRDHLVAFFDCRVGVSRNRGIGSENSSDDWGLSGLVWFIPKSSDEGFCLDYRLSFSTVELIGLQNGGTRQTTDRVEAWSQSFLKSSDDCSRRNLIEVFPKVFRRGINIKYPFSFMNLTSHYNSLWNRSIQKFKAGEFELDSLIDSESDTRYGITLLARPSIEVKERICSLIESLKSTAPDQYFYPGTDLHITILSIISCYRGFTPGQINPADYCKLIQPAVDSVSPFRLTFRGITASPSSIMIQGFPEDEQLNTLRNILRSRFKDSDLQHSIDKRYNLKTAHVTAIRFKQPLLDEKAFINTLTGLKDRSLGSCLIDELELVSNDWYQRKDKVRLIKTFNLSQNLK